jgi:hypothetical protein
VRPVVDLDAVLLLERLYLVRWVLILKAYEMRLVPENRNNVSRVTDRLDLPVWFLPPVHEIPTFGSGPRESKRALHCNAISGFGFRYGVPGKVFVPVPVELRKLADRDPPIKGIFPVPRFLTLLVSSAVHLAPKRPSEDVLQSENRTR